MDYSRRFKMGGFRYMTRAFIEEGYIIIHQTERCDAPKMEYRSTVMLSTEDFKKMSDTLLNQ